MTSGSRDDRSALHQACDQQLIFLWLLGTHHVLVARHHWHAADSLVPGLEGHLVKTTGAG